MERSDLLKSSEYWITKIQLGLYDCADEFMEKQGLNRAQLAKYLGVSRGYISQILNGNYDHRLSKLVELALSFGYVPSITFTPIDEVIARDKQPFKSVQWKVCEYAPTPNGMKYEKKAIHAHAYNNYFDSCNRQKKCA